MPILQITVLFVIAGGAVACLFAIYRSLEKLAKSISSISAELAKMNGKLEIIEAVNADDLQKSDDQRLSELEDIETAISNFEKLKREDSTEPQVNKL